MEKYPYIVVEGNIGSGKTSLVKMLTKEFSAHAIYEEFSDCNKLTHIELRIEYSRYRQESDVILAMCET